MFLNKNWSARFISAWAAGARYMSRPLSQILSAPHFDSPDLKLMLQENCAGLNNSFTSTMQIYKSMGLQDELRLDADQGMGRRVDCEKKQLC